MLAKYQDHAEDIMLAKDVDEFWHTHILQTIKYADDCEQVFATFLHHTPHVGERTAADLEKRARQAEKTRRLYEREFGAGGSSAWAGAAIEADKAAYSGVAIKAEGAAYSGVAVRAAYSGATIKAANAAYSGATIKAENAAYSGATIKAENAAYSGATIAV